MGVFGKIGEAKYSEGGVYLKPGVFRLEIQKVKFQKTRKGQEAFLVEFLVLDSTNPEHPKGSAVTWMVTMDKEPAMGNVKQFIATAFHDKLIELKIPVEGHMDAIDEATAELVISDQQPLTGKVVRASANNITTKAGRPFTKVKFLADAAGHDAAASSFAAG
jgi:hypothetical protein